MGKHGGKSKKQEDGQSSDGSVKKIKGGINSPKANDSDTAVFVSMSQELKEEGNKLFQKRDHEGAMLKYEKAIKLLPRNHIDISYLRSNMAACYMQMGISEYPRAIHECNLALEVAPKYSKALIKRAKCYEALNRLDLALRDVSTVLKGEVNNIMALEIEERVRYALERKGLQVNDTVIELPPDYVEPPCLFSMPKLGNKKSRKKKSKKSKKVVEKTTRDETEGMTPGDETEEKTTGDEIEEKKVDREESKAEDKVVVEETISSVKEEPKQTVKLVLGEDIRCAQLPLNCSLMKLREVVCDRFPGTGDVLIKYRDKEGDLVTITCDEELRWAEASAKAQNSVRLHLVRGDSLQELFFDAPEGEEEEQVDTLHMKQKLDNGNGNMENEKQPGNGGYYIDEWIVEFAKLFKDHVGFDSNAYLGLREVGLKVYSEALEETVTSEEAQGFFDTAAGKFQEMAALALFYWGNVYMSRARKRIYFTEDASRETILQQIATAYDRALKEYIKAGQRYEEALRIKPDLYEAHLALGQQQFEQAKLSWYYAVSNHANLEKWPSEDVVQLYNKAEDSMERGMEMWEEMAAERLSSLANSTKIRPSMQKGLDSLFQDISVEEAHEQIRNMRSQMNLIWATILYERSVMEFRLGLHVWGECFEVAIEKFELAGASPTDIAVMTKNHVSSGNAVEGFGFTIDEIVQAWNEMYEAKKLLIRIPSFRLEPLLRRRVSNLYHAFELL